MSIQIVLNPESPAYPELPELCFSSELSFWSGIRGDSVVDCNHCKGQFLSIMILVFETFENKTSNSMAQKLI